MKTLDCNLTKDLVFQETSGEQLKLQNVKLVMLQTDSTVSEVRLGLQVSPEIYHHIETQTLFNLKTEIRGSLTNGNFLPDANYQLDLTLQPNLLPSLLEKAATADEAAAYLLSLNEQQNLNNSPAVAPPESTATQPPSKPDEASPQSSPSSANTDAEAPTSSEQTQANDRKVFRDLLLHTESWFCLSVKQQQGESETGFETFWSYVNPTILQQAATSGEQLAEGIAKFFQEWVATNLSEAVQETTDELIDEITNAFQGLADDLSAIDWDAIDETADRTADKEKDPEKGILFDTVVSFFEANDWPIARVDEKTSLQLAFQGENGQWSCYASTHERRRAFVFYSLCPVNVPKPQRGAIAEFLTRVNYGITLGNFEMDFDSGEINYKTSINIGDDRLSTALVQQLVYANVIIMDQYLPGILAIIYGNRTPLEAIADIEVRSQIS